MQGLCISLDVSKGSSYYQGFTSMNEPVGKAKKIEHDDKGFKELSKLKERMEKEYEDEVKFVFVSTIKHFRRTLMIIITAILSFHLYYQRR